MNTPPLMTPALLLHIFGAAIGLLSGFTAMIFRKGSGWHGAAGSVFFGSMIVMTTSAVYVATVERPHPLNQLVGMLTFYLVVTSWRAAKRRQGGTNGFDVALLLFIVGDGLFGISSGVKAAASAAGKLHGIPAGLYLFFGSMALLAAYRDVRMLQRGGYTGMQRIARHLHRMVWALFITLFSLYPGNAKLFPKAWRETNLLFIPHILLFGALVYYGWRYSSRKRRATQERAADMAMASA